MPAYINDPTKVEYYRFFYITWLETDIGCGDSTTPRTIYFHKNSTATFTDPGVGETKTITIQYVSVSNQYVSGSTANCDTRETDKVSYINSLVNSTMSTYNASLEWFE